MEGVDVHGAGWQLGSFQRVPQLKRGQMEQICPVLDTVPFNVEQHSKHGLAGLARNWRLPVKLHSRAAKLVHINSK